MLEVKNLTKIYKNKKGINIKALNDISITFPETGMIFLLGKSGSGKSTLLNVCGGLDEPTSGEIIVKGRSSKSFSKSDFDSYRNTFIGFVFQEYNILNEFTVEENISLALELQGKPKDKTAINELLTKVDLEGYAKRKPNTLSGGQKQRIAIARALIKEPEIIMADEPTGALDSTTGKQVLETLKKLSKNKLVIVVSHDREFAENYADRIIELKDGKIISDLSKTYEKQEEISENLSAIGNILHIKKGSKLNEKDFSEIKTFLNNSETDIILAKGEEDIKAFKTASRITSSGEKEIFKETPEFENKKQYKKEDSKFIRSKLPLKHAFKIGASSLKHKPIRLFFTIILCTISFVIFGVLSTITFYNSESTFKQTLKDSSLEYMPITKYYQLNETWYYNGEKMDTYPVSYQTSFSLEEYKEYQKEYGKDTFYGISTDYTFNVQLSSSSYWINKINTLAYLEEDNSLRLKINGKYPSDDNEICISSYTANVIYNNKIYVNDSNKTLDLSAPEDIIGKTININNNKYKVVGIIDSGKLDEKYDTILSSNETNNMLISEFRMKLSEGLHLTAFVSESTLKTVSNEISYHYGNDVFTNRSISAVIKKDGKFDFPSYSNSSYAGYSNKPKKDEVIELISNKTEPNDNETIISKDLFYDLMMKYYNEKMSKGDMDAYKYYDIAFELSQRGYYKYNEKTNESEFIKFTEKELNSKLNTLIKAFKNEDEKLKIGIKLFDTTSQQYIGEQKEMTVIGIWITNNSSYQSGLLLSDKLANELWEAQKVNLNDYVETSTNYEVENTQYGVIYLPYDKSEELTQKFLEIYQNNEYNEDDSKVLLSGYIIDSLEMIDSVVESLSTVFLYLGIALAIFSVLLFSNFISVSISYKKKEIGILRAIGARSADVFKIFFSESFLITLICVILSLIGNLFITNVLNTELSTGIGVSLFVFGITSLLVLITLALLTAVIATFIPVYNAAKKKPVESIRAI